MKGHTLHWDNTRLGLQEKTGTLIYAWLCKEGSQTIRAPRTNEKTKRAMKRIQAQVRVALMRRAVSD